MNLFLVSFLSSFSYLNPTRVHIPVSCGPLVCIVTKYHYFVHLLIPIDLSERLTFLSACSMDQASKIQTDTGSSTVFGNTYSPVLWSGTTISIVAPKWSLVYPAVQDLPPFIPLPHVEIHWYNGSPQICVCYLLLFNFSVTFQFILGHVAEAKLKMTQLNSFLEVLTVMCFGHFGVVAKQLKKQR